MLQIQRIVPLRVVCCPERGVADSNGFYLSSEILVLMVQETVGGLLANNLVAEGVNLLQEMLVGLLYYGSAAIDGRRCAE